MQGTKEKASAYASNLESSAEEVGAAAGAGGGPPCPRCLK